MVRKKTNRTSGKVLRGRKRSRKSALSTDIHFLNRIISCLYQTGVPINLNDLIKQLGLPRSAKQKAGDALEILSQQGAVVADSKNRYFLNKKLMFAEATLEKNRKGFGFGADPVTHKGMPPFDRDPFISASRMGSARHGDRVLLRIIRVRKDGRPEAEIVSVIKRSTARLAGIIHMQNGVGILTPDDIRHPPVVIMNVPDNVKEGDAAVVKLIDTSDAVSRPRAEIVRVLGDPQKTEVQAMVVAEQFSLPCEFSSTALDDAEQGTPHPGLEERSDLTDILHYTIDGADAKDFDDAVAVQKTRKGFKLFVSIADVSAYVQKGTNLDEEAYQRGTSVYFPGMVIPMLPEILSNDLCSLTPGKEKLTVTVVIDYDRQGKVIKTNFNRSIIRSYHRFTYGTVKKILIDKDPAARKAHKQFLTPLKWAGELAQILIEKRNKRGSIGFSLPEADIRLDKDGEITSITKKQRNFAHLLIEEFMLAANESVARFLYEKRQETLYRIHEKPDSEKLSAFKDFFYTLPLATRQYGDNEGPSWYNCILDSVRNTPYEYLVNSLALRTMQQARYSPENKGHFGLALDLYTHFTSPIRRYPDLIVHRQLCNAIISSSGKQNRKKGPALGDCGTHLSERERNAIAAERDMEERLKRRFMSGKIGESFSSIISGVSDSALYVELDNFFISGQVPLSFMKDDYYLLDEKNHRLIGDISGKIMQIGDHLKVVLKDVDDTNKKILFCLENDTFSG